MSYNQGLLQLGVLQPWFLQLGVLQSGFLQPGVLKPGVPTTRAEVVDLIKEEVNIVTLHFQNLKFDFEYLLGSWSSLNRVFLS